MRLLGAAILCGAVLASAGCVAARADSGQKLKQETAARCRQLDADASAADRALNSHLAALEAREAKEWTPERKARFLANPDAFIEAEEKEAGIDAEAYASGVKMRQARDCWNYLRTVQDTHAFVRSQNAAMGDAIDAEWRARASDDAPPAHQVDPSTFTPPAPPPPSPIGVIPSYASPPPAPPPQFIPYEAVSPFMPGIGPGGTAR